MGLEACDARRTSQNATFMSFLLAEHNSSGCVGCQLMHSTWVLCPPDRDVVPRTSICARVSSQRRETQGALTHTAFWLPYAYGALIAARREIFAVAAPGDGEHGVLAAHARVSRAPCREVGRLRRVSAKGDREPVTETGRTMIWRAAKEAYSGM